MSLPSDPEVPMEKGHLSIVEDSDKNTYKQMNQDMVVIPELP